MGIDHQTLRLLLVARTMGVDFERTITLGRQDILLPGPELVRAFELFKFPLTASRAAGLLNEADRFADPLFRELGASVTDSMDRSAFEGATVLHDLNRPLPESLRARYTLVFDGGTLEHVFDFPRALENCMELAAVGGHVITVSPANNLMGHGFYQISPELYWRAFSAANGFEVRCVLMIPAFSEGAWFSVRDPAAVRRRIGHNRGSNPLYLCAIARRVALGPLFSEPPQQSDYAAEWSEHADKFKDPMRLAFLGEPRKPRSARAIASRFVPSPLKVWLRSLRQARSDALPPDTAEFEPFPLPPSARAGTAASHSTESSGAAPTMVTPDQ